MARNQTLSFGLVSIEVSIDKATTDPSKEVSLKMATEDGEPVKQVYVTEADYESGEESSDWIKSEDLVKGKFVGEDFHEVPTEQLEIIKERTGGTGVLDLEFEKLETLDLEYATGLHFVKAKKGFAPKMALLAAAMEKEGMAAVTTYVPSSRQSLAAIFVKDGVMYLAQLPFVAQIKPVPEAARVDTTGIPKKQIDMARKLVKAAKGKRSVEAVDEAVELKGELIEQVLDGAELTKPEPAKAIKQEESLEALLEKSLAA